MRRKSVLFWAGLGLLTAFLCWRIVVVNFAEHYARLDYYAQYDSRQEFVETPANVSAALSWSANQPHAMVKQAFFLARQEPEQALQILQQAVRKNPADARAYVLAGVLEAGREDAEKAEQLMQAGVRLAPMNNTVHQHIASYYFSVKNIKAALPSLVRLIGVSAYNGRSNAFAALLTIASVPALRNELAAVVKNLPPWWPQFFAYAADSSKNAETLDFLFSLNSAPRASELQTYLHALLAHKRWQDAYILWLDSLTEQELGVAGLLFNGAFEVPFSDTVFAWRIDAYGGGEIARRAEPGNHFLQISFNGWELPFRHLSQHLLLSPGEYLFRGRVKMDNVQSAQGLKWQVFCSDAQNSLNAESELMRGNHDWREFRFRISIPAYGCEGQVLRLVSHARFAREHRISGIAQFDDLVIARDAGSLD